MLVRGSYMYKPGQLNRPLLGATVYLASMAVINGASSVEEVTKVVKKGFMGVMRVSSNSLHFVTQRRDSLAGNMDDLSSCNGPCPEVHPTGGTEYAIPYVPL